MTTEQARSANVDTSPRVVSLAATLPRLVRLVHLSGYCVGGQAPSSVPWSEARVASEYRRLGAYEARSRPPRRGGVTTPVEPLPAHQHQGGRRRQESRPGRERHAAGAGAGVIVRGHRAVAAALRRPRWGRRCS